MVALSSGEPREKQNKTIHLPGDFTRDLWQLLGFACEAKCAFAECATPSCEVVPATSSRSGAPLIHACLRNSSKIDTDRARVRSRRHSAPAIGGKLKTFRVSEKCWRRRIESAKERKWVRDFWISFNAETPPPTAAKAVGAVFVHEILTSLSRRRHAYLYKSCTHINSS